jgi:hypothetical protein
MHCFSRASSLYSLCTVFCALLYSVLYALFFARFSIMFYMHCFSRASSLTYCRKTVCLMANDSYWLTQIAGAVSSASLDYIPKAT